MKKILLLSTLCLMAGQMVMGRSITLTTDDPDLKQSYYSTSGPRDGLTQNGTMNLFQKDGIPSWYTFGWNRPMAITEKVTGFAMWVQIHDTMYNSVDSSGNVLLPIPIPTTPTDITFKVAKASTPCTSNGVGCYLTVTPVPQTTTMATKHTRKKQG